MKRLPPFLLLGTVVGSASGCFGIVEDGKKEPTADKQQFTHDDVWTAYTEGATTATIVVNLERFIQDRDAPDVRLFGRWTTAEGNEVEITQVTQKSDLLGTYATAVPVDGAGHYQIELVALAVGDQSLLQTPVTKGMELLLEEPAPDPTPRRANANGDTLAPDSGSTEPGHLYALTAKAAGCTCKGETVSWTGESSVYRGTDCSDTVHAGPGDDTIETFGGRDSVWGGAGDDHINLGFDNCYIEFAYGESGDDVLVNQGGVAVLNGGPGNDYLEAFQPRGAPVEPFQASMLEGGSGNDSLYGGPGDDDLRGQGDDDQLLGGEGNDNLEGGHGDDHLAGEAGADELNGGPGYDRCSGGEGADVFVDCEETFVYVRP